MRRRVREVVHCAALQRQCASGLEINSLGHDRNLIGRRGELLRVGRAATGSGDTVSGLDARDALAHLGHRSSGF